MPVATPASPPSDDIDDLPTEIYRPQKPARGGGAAGDPLPTRATPQARRQVPARPAAASAKPGLGPVNLTELGDDWEHETTIHRPADVPHDESVSEIEIDIDFSDDTSASRRR